MSSDVQPAHLLLIAIPSSAASCSASTREHYLHVMSKRSNVGQVSPQYRLDHHVILQRNQVTTLQEWRVLMYFQPRHACRTPFPVTLAHRPTQRTRKSFAQVSYTHAHEQHISNLHDLAKRGDKRLRKPKGENKLGPSHEKLGCESLEKRSEPLVLHHVGNDLEAAFGVLKVPVLDSSLDDVEWSGDKKRGAGTGNRSDEVLSPCGGVVVGELVEVFLGRSGSTK
jgi:hypothetical protein